MNELRSAAIPDAQEAMRWVGMRVDDIYGKQIGRLSDVWTDPITDEPAWLLVRYGAGADACTLIPLREATAAPRRIWVPFDRDFVRNGPWVHRHTTLSAKTSTAFAEYYRLRGPAGSRRVTPSRRFQAPDRQRQHASRRPVNGHGRAPAAISAKLAALSATLATAPDPTH